MAIYSPVAARDGRAQDELAIKGVRTRSGGRRCRRHTAIVLSLLPATVPNPFTQILGVEIVWAEKGAAADARRRAARDVDVSADRPPSDDSRESRPQPDDLPRLHRFTLSRDRDSRTPDSHRTSRGRDGGRRTPPFAPIRSRVSAAFFQAGSSACKPSDRARSEEHTSELQSPI